MIIRLGGFRFGPPEVSPSSSEKPEASFLRRATEIQGWAGTPTVVLVLFRTFARESLSGEKNTSMPFHPQEGD